MRQVDKGLEDGSAGQEHHKEKWMQSPDCPCLTCVALGGSLHLSIYK